MGKTKKRDGGWQVNVEYFDNYVIKTPKSKEEIEIKVRQHLEFIQKTERLEQRVNDMLIDWKKSIIILKRKKIPKKILGDIVFLKNGKIKQKRVVTLRDKWNQFQDEGKEEEMKKLVDKSLEFILELWRYGIHDKTFKVGNEMGVDENGKIILIDFGELTDKKEIVKKLIIKKKWIRMMKDYNDKVILDYFNQRADEVLTLINLENNWKVNCN